jgi:HEPN domain-containing protein
MSTPPAPAAVFLAKAREDLYLAGKIKDDPNVSVEQVGFFCEQAVEKSLKAVLTRRAVRFRRGHDIAQYLDLLKAAAVTYPAELEKAVELTPFGAELRYDFLPKEEIEATPFDREAAYGLAGRAVSWAESIV